MNLLVALKKTPATTKGLGLSTSSNQYAVYVNYYTYLWPTRKPLQQLNGWAYLPVTINLSLCKL